MVQKPKIQYVGEFYIYGSEARQLEEQKKRRPKTGLPMAKLEKIETIYIDPVALVGIAVAIFMLVTMAIGALQLRDDWESYHRMSAYVSELKKENAALAADYRDGYDLEDIRKKAVGLGLVETDQAQTMTVRVRLPEPEAKTSWWEDMVWFFQGLFE